MSKTAVIFPGQGAQHVGMGRDFAEASAAARAVFEEADRILRTLRPAGAERPQPDRAPGMPLSRICFEGPADRLNATDCAQPAIFVTSVAIWHALRAQGPAEELDPAAMAGLSLGEYTALHLAGWMDFEPALRLVAERGRLMQAAAGASDGGMASIMGLEEEAVLRLCAEAAAGQVLAPANFNCPGQIVISGAKKACERAVALAERYGARAVPLTVAGAFHSPLMASAAEGLAPALAETPIRRGRIGVVSNVSADYHAGSEDVRALLREQVARPVRWQASMERLRADGFERFVEVGPGRVLTGLMRKIDRGATAVNYSKAEVIAHRSVEGRVARR